MSTAQFAEPVSSQTPARVSRKPLRLWPGVAAAALIVVGWFIVPFVLPKAMLYGMLGGAAGVLVVALWWLFFSRARWLERLGAIVLMFLAIIATKRIVHPSIAGGMMGMMFFVYAIPVLSLVLVGWAAISRRFGTALRWATMVCAIVLACAVFLVLRTGGISGEGSSDLHWRWSKTPEDRLLVQAANEPANSTAALAESPTAMSESGWPGFRGPNRDSIIRGVRIETDWSQKPPIPMWHRPIGPGWSSFAARDNFFYTQEQRGDNEVVSCYNLTTGQPVWKHSDATRFYESNAGAGPRGTPSLSNGRVYTLGGTGILNALDARNGSVVWSRNAASDTKTKVPHWGFASSPLVVGDIVIVATAGALSAYDIATGNPRWIGPTGGGGGYSSPHLLTIDGVAQVLLLNGEGAISVAPADGTVLWKHAWAGDGITQPAATADGDVLIGAGSGMAQVGLVRFAVAHETSGWTTKERWKSTELNPYYNDFVVHKDHAFGFDGTEIVCVDLKNGGLKWRGGNYGTGQLVLLADQDLLLVVSEKGELALVKATPDRFAEVARFKAIEGKTWNHPALVGDTLLVRNAEEMAAFRLPLATR